MKYQQVFRRVEKKYLLNEKQYKMLMEVIERHLVPDRYHISTICNIYYDTPDFRLIRTSLEKPVYKEKFRIRSYGVPKGKDRIFVELKKKYHGVVYKRRTDMKLEQLNAFLNNEKPAGKNVQIEKEIQYFLDFYEDIAPRMFISYNRTSFCGAENPDLRITFDRGIMYRDNDLELDKGIKGVLLLKPDECLMEIKVPGAFPMWLSRAINELGIFPTSFSKYGRAYQRTFGSILKKGKVSNCA